MTTIWEQHDFETTITAILEQVHYYEPEHHFGRPYLAAYQLAIAFARRAPEAVTDLGYQIGGEGTGERNSLAQYIARELSARIKDGRIHRIEGAFLSNLHLNDITFMDKDNLIRSSLTGSGYDLSMFRLRPDR